MQITVTPDELRAYEQKLSAWYQARMETANNAFQRHKLAMDSSPEKAAVDAVRVHDEANPRPRFLPNI